MFKSPKSLLSKGINQGIDLKLVFRKRIGQESTPYHWLILYQKNGFGFRVYSHFLLVLTVRDFPSVVTARDFFLRQIGDFTICEKCKKCYHLLWICDILLSVQKCKRFFHLQWSVRDFSICGDYKRFWEESVPSPLLQCFPGLTRDQASTCVPP